MILDANGRSVRRAIGFGPTRFVPETNGDCAVELVGFSRIEPEQDYDGECGAIETLKEDEDAYR